MYHFGGSKRSLASLPKPIRALSHGASKEADKTVSNAFKFSRACAIFHCSKQGKPYWGQQMSKDQLIAGFFEWKKNARKGGQ